MSKLALSTIKNSLIVKLICVIFIMFLIIYWSKHLIEALELHGVIGNRNMLPGLIQWVLSWMMLLSFFGLVGWLNFKFVYFYYLQKEFNIYIFLLIQLLLIGAFFEILQWKTDYEKELADANLLLAFIGGAFLLVFNLVLDAIATKRNQEMLLRQKSDAELKLLQSQLNPHFLFNALNSIYSKALVESQSDLAIQIEQLASLLRFSLEKSGNETISIQEELDFIRKYIDLQLSRWSNDIRKNIAIDIDSEDEGGEIAPMLLQPWIENAFKYGLEQYEPLNCKIEIAIRVSDGKIEMQVQNKKHTNSIKKGTGKSTNNVKSRLTSLYRNKHQLIINDDGTFYTVHLTIQLE